MRAVVLPLNLEECYLHFCLMSHFGIPFARGRTADIFIWDRQRILKLYREGYPAAIALKERENARLAHNCGIQTPSAYEVVTYETRCGIIFDRLDGSTLFQTLTARSANAIARRLGILHASIHNCQVAALPSQQTLLATKIERAPGLTSELKAIALARLADLSEDNCCCHGDFHPGNVIAIATGDCAIDWLDASQGDAIADVARTVLLLACTPLAAPDLESVRIPFARAYLQAYASVRPCDRERLGACLLPVAIARWAEPLPHAERKILQQAIASLAKGDLALLDAIY